MVRLLMSPLLTETEPTNIKRGVSMLKIQSLVIQVRLFETLHIYGLQLMTQKP